MPVEQQDEILVSVVIPTHNRFILLEETVECLWQQTLASHLWEIIVVDDCSTDDTPERIKELESRSPCRLAYHRLDRNGGPARARNAGAGRARGTFLMFMDSDISLDSNWLERAVEHARREERLGLLAGKLLYALRPDHINIYGGRMSRIGLAWDGYERELSSTVTQPIECLWTASGAVFIPRNVFVQLGGFDDTFFYYYEDSDIGWRANLMGYRCVCVPDLMAYHRVCHRPAVRGALIAFHSCKNRIRSMAKNFGRAYLAMYLPMYFAYALADLAVRSPRLPKLKALLWNVKVLPDTMRLRGEIQRNRTVSDAQIARLFSSRLFPPETVDARDRRYIELREGEQHEAAGAHP